jgi:DNA-binding CsgD family transcriptional regulator
VLTIIICAVISIIAIITVIRLDSTWKERENIQAKSDREKLLVQQQRKIEKMQDKIDYQNIDIIVKNNRIKELKQKNERIEYQLQQCKERLQSTEIQLKAFQSENKQVIVSDNIINAVTEKIASSDVSEPLSDISERDKQIMNCLDAGMSFREVARECNCSVGTISNVRKRLEQATWAGTAR